MDDVKLHRLQLSAKIDFITFLNPAGRMVSIPPLHGSVNWSRKFHYRRFTVHDPSPADIEVLMSLFGCDLPILEMEVAIDFRPSASGADMPLLKSVMVDVFGRRLCPSASSLAGVARRAYRPRLKRVIMLKNSPCGPEDQMLLGARGDRVQVKCYLKQRDQNQPLDDTEAVARLEVRLAQEELKLLGIPTLICIQGFSWRKSLMPYFRHRVPVSKVGSGCGVFQRKFETEINDRIGQSLTRLERRFCDVVLSKESDFS